MIALAQVRAIVRLFWRHFRRRPMRAGANPHASRLPASFLLSLVAMAYLGNAAWMVFSRAANLRSGRVAAMGWQLIGVVALSIGFGLADLQPEIGRLRSPLRASLLDELPVTATARVALACVRNPFGLLVCLVAAFAWSPARRHSGAGVAWLCAAGLLLYLATVTTGYALTIVVRVARPAWQRPVSYASPALVLSGIALVQVGPLIRAVWPGAIPTLAVVALALGDRALVGVELAWWAAALGVIALGERRGYDRLDAAPARRARSGAITRDNAERRLAWREGGLGVLIGSVMLGLMFLGAGVGALVALHRQKLTVEELADGARYFCGAMAYCGAIFSLGRAGVAARRDAAARALLAPLPITPYETLEGKVRALRRSLAPIVGCATLAAVVVLVRVAPLDPRAALTMAARLAATLAALFVGADAAVSIAFLTSGVGLPGMRSLGASFNLAPTLLLLPILSTGAAPNVFIALASLGTTVAVAFEARRAARRCVRWLDDADDALDRETTVWRALLALAAFFSAQALAYQVLSAAGAPPGWAMALTYSTAAIVLVALTRSGRRGLAPLRLWPKRTIALGLGLAGGALSGAAAMGLGRLIERFGPVQAETPALGGPIVLLALALVVAAPVAEEVFFRGWLQEAIAAELPEARKRWAFAVAAAAFACAHVGSYVVPQLVLGLLAGALYAWSGALLPGMLAHAMHNGLVLFFTAP